MYNNSIVKSGRSKAKVVAIAVVAVVLLAAIILICLKNLKSAKLSIMLAPYDSAVAKIDGKEYKSGTYSFMPRQNVTVTISAPGFEEKTVIVNLEKKHTATVYEYLKNNENGLEYALKSDNDTKILTLLGNRDKEAQEIIKRSKKNKLIVSELPITKYYSNHPTGGSEAAYPKMHILNAKQQGYECKRSICLLVTGQKGNDAEKVLAERGYNIEDFEVFYEK